ncbi:acylneuraminate cytidylyltransferase family protein [Heliobacterium chlorum]|uniref:Acylneuraminate cytidylyltransferase family protein n=1 Tax=Heliobacterium chlorum TaxID=2698 RepID=A0ABR7T0V7_HELCL|nr:acylneuraminate cytidylyltransferase family protein [Heliobacterium chlorum]MBC9784429.1 acylneuraminate cytidylyltransferase family protein [Heliobacterium chlorum]
MIDGKTILAIIPARGGSKGVPRKNIRILGDKPLIAWTIEEAKKSKYIDRLILSSEDSEIIATAQAWGCEIPFVRPLELAKDDTPGISPVLHAVEMLPNYDYILLLQPTSPLRSVQDIDGCIEWFESRKDKFSACVSVTEVEKSPYWMYSVELEGSMSPILDMGEMIFRRQELAKSYSLNGAIYIAERDWLLEQKSFLGKQTGAFIMPRERSFDIDSELDFMLCEFALKAFGPS